MILEHGKAVFCPALPITPPVISAACARTALCTTIDRSARWVPGSGPLLPLPPAPGNRLQPREFGCTAFVGRGMPVAVTTSRISGPHGRPSPHRRRRCPGARSIWHVRRPEARGPHILVSCPLTRVPLSLSYCFIHGPSRQRAAHFYKLGRGTTSPAPV